MIFSHTRPPETLTRTTETLRVRADNESTARDDDLAASLLSDLALGFATAMPTRSSDICTLVELTAEIERCMVAGADADANDR